MNTPLYWHKAIRFLSKQDQVMGKLISSYPDESLQNYNNAFCTLAKAIVGQQISVKAADAIWSRLVFSLDILTPEAYLSLSKEQLRQCGLSRQKITYLTNICLAFQQNLLTPDLWLEMSDSQIKKQLMQIRGIGIWTAEMFLIFHLHRPDVLPLTDIGLIKAINQHYGQSESLSKTVILEIAQNWQPYRTVATWYLWRSLDPLVVQY